MRQLLAAMILGGALAVTASAAFADIGDRDYPMPSEPSTSGVALQNSVGNVGLSGTDVQPTWDHNERF